MLIQSTCWKSLSLFLFIALLDYSSSAEVTKGPNCRYNSPHLFGPRCCDDQRFNYRHLESHFDKCNVQPMDPDSSISSNYWDFLECLISNSLGSKPLTLNNFAELITKNLTESSKSAILTLLQSSAQSSKINGGEGKQSSSVLPTIWKNYMDAEYNVCTAKAVAESKDASSENPWKWEVPDREHWDAQLKCGNGSHPYIYPFQKEYTRTMNSTCAQSLKKKYGTGNAVNEELCIEYACEFIDTGLILESKLDEAVDFEAAVQKFLPPILSQNSRKIIMDEFRVKPPSVGESRDRSKLTTMAEIISYVKGYAEKKEVKNLTAGISGMCKNIWTLEALRGRLAYSEIMICGEI